MLGRRLAAVVIVASILATGCTFPEEDRFVGSEADGRLTTVPIQPEAADITVDRGETVGFVVRCQAPEPPRTVEVTWERAVTGEGVDGRSLDRGSSEDDHSFTTSFDEVDDYVVTAKCRSDDDRAPVHLWTVTVEEAEDDPDDEGNRTASPVGTGPSPLDEPPRPATPATRGLTR